MEELTVEQWMEKYPYLRNMAEYTLFTTREDVEQIRNGEKVKVNSEDVSIEFLKRILNNDFYFEYASRYFNGDINNFAVCYIMGGDTGGSIYYKKSTIIKALEQLISSGQIVLQPDEQQKLDSLKNSISFEKFLEKHKGNKYNIDIHDLYNINELLKKGYLNEDDEYIFIPKEYIYVSNDILINFI